MSTNGIGGGSDSFAKAAAVPRGCGDSREPGGYYLECGLDKNGSPISEFLIDPPITPPEDIRGAIRKPQLWEDPQTQINHVVIWVGAEFYPYLSDYVEEVARFGASRRIPQNFQFEKLSPHSTMIFVHRYALNPHWETQLPPHACPKLLLNHFETGSSGHEKLEGPCLGKAWDLMPKEAADKVVIEGGKVDELTGEVAPSIYLRNRPSFSYLFQPTFETIEVENRKEAGWKGLQPGIFMALPISCVAYIRQSEETDKDKKTREKASKKMKQAGLNFYETDK